MKKIGIITFHNSYNCGSMLESYAMQQIMSKYGEPEIIDYSSDGQREVYSVFRKNRTIKAIVANFIIWFVKKRIKLNNSKYEEFKNRYFSLSKKVDENSIRTLEYDTVIAGSDQIWNTTIEDYNDVYFLNWCDGTEKVAYAPSFGAKNPIEYCEYADIIKGWLNSFSVLSIRENNGRKWLGNLGFKNVPVVSDPTLLLERADYEKIEDISFNPGKKYIFFYSPSFDRKICRFVKKVANKYGLEVITWSTKSYYLKFVKQFSFKLPPYENPAMYLNLIKNAELIFTTSYHGTIFSTIYRKKFFCIKNGGMYGDDDRVITLLNQLGIMERLIEYKFNDSYNYLMDVDYIMYDKSLEKLKKKSLEYLDNAMRKK